MWCDVMGCSLRWYVEKTRRIIWDGLLGYDRTEWQRTLKDLEEHPRYWVQGRSEQVLYVKGLIASKTNVVITHRDRPKMGSITSSPMGPSFRFFPMVVLCCMIFVCSWVCLDCIKKNKTIIKLLYIEAWNMCYLVIFSIRCSRVIGVWLGADQRTNTMKVDWTSSTFIYMLHIQQWPHLGGHMY